MRVVAIALALGLAAPVPSHARLGDSPAQTAVRYGQPVASSGKPGAQTSQQVFTTSGLKVTCGYVGGKVEMESYSRGDRDFNPVEVQALLRTNGSKQLPWVTPIGGFVNGTYTRSDGTTATLTGAKLAIQTSKWTAALAKDQTAGKASAPASASPASTNSVNPNYSTGAGTNAASYFGIPDSTNAPASGGSSVPHTTTNAP